MPFNATANEDGQGFSVTRFQYDESEIIYFGSNRVVTEQEALDIVQPFSFCPALRVLEICDRDESPMRGNVTFTSRLVHDTLIPLPYGKGFVPHVSVMGKN